MKYDKLKKKMRAMIRLAKEVIEECEKDSPDDVLISDMAIEELEDLLNEISVSINRDGFSSQNDFDIVPEVIMPNK